jgi:diacylglycerol O-acyltransferase / wax synthase
VAVRARETGTSVERMTALDTWFLHVEDDVNHMHIGSIGVFEGPAPRWQELRDAIDAKLDLIPRYRQRYRDVARGLARPVWVADPHFDLDYHVRHTALPRPGDDDQLRRLVGRIMGQQLDRRRPLWETWFVEGLDDDRWAMISKVHHCVVDGVAGTDLLATVLDADPDAVVATPSAEPREAGAARTGDGTRPLVGAVAHAATAVPRRVGQALAAPLRDPVGTVGAAAAAVKGVGELSGVVRRMPPTSLTGPIGPHRRYATADASLEDAKAIKRALGGTVNDVVLAAITTGFRDLLAARGELTATSVVRTLVPVSLRREDQRGDLHNLVAALFLALPVGTDDPAERYRVVRDTMEELKGSGEQVTTAALVGATDLAPTAFVGLALRGVSSLLHRHQRYITTVTTNVPGPQTPQYLLGRRMVKAYPFVPIAEGLRTGVAIFSYDGQLTFGVTADLGEVPDVEVLTDGVVRGMAELLALVR